MIHLGSGGLGPLGGLALAGTPPVNSGGHVIPELPTESFNIELPTYRGPK